MHKQWPTVDLPITREKIWRAARKAHGSPVPWEYMIWVYIKETHEESQLRQKSVESFMLSLTEKHEYEKPSQSLLPANPVKGLMMRAWKQNSSTEKLPWQHTLTLWRKCHGRSPTPLLLSVVFLRAAMGRALLLKLCCYADFAQKHLGCAQQREGLSVSWLSFLLDHIFLSYSTYCSYLSQ